MYPPAAFKKSTMGRVALSRGREKGSREKNGATLASLLTSEMGFASRLRTRPKLSV